MKKRAGFTLVELIIAIAIMAIVFGGLVALFGRTSIASRTGLNQEKAYEEARLVMEQLKTSLRYANKDEIKNQSNAAPAIGDTYGAASTLTYTGSAFDKHWDVSNGVNVNYQVTVAWTGGSNNKQIHVVITDTDSKKELKNITFPKEVANSAFTGDGTDFPVQYEKFTTNDNKESNLYTVTLPVQYQLNGSAKIDTLTSKVTPTDYSNGTIKVVDNTPIGAYQATENFIEILNKWEGYGTNYEHDLKTGWSTLTADEQQLVKDIYNYLKKYNDRYRVANNQLPDFNPESASIWYQLTNRAPIRDYFKNEFFGGSFPTTTFSNGVKIYTKPYVLYKRDTSSFSNILNGGATTPYDPPASVLMAGSTDFNNPLGDDQYIRYALIDGKWYQARQYKYNYGWTYYNPASQKWVSISDSSGNGWYTTLDYYYYGFALYSRGEYIWRSLTSTGNSYYYNFIYYNSNTEYCTIDTIKDFIKNNWDLIS